MNPELGDDDLPIGPAPNFDSLSAQIDDCSRMIAELPSVAEDMVEHTLEITALRQELEREHRLATSYRNTSDHYCKLAQEREELLLRAYVALGSVPDLRELRTDIGEHLGVEGSYEALSVLESMRNPYANIDDEVPF